MRFLFYFLYSSYTYGYLYCQKINIRGKNEGYLNDDSKSIFSQIFAYKYQQIQQITIQLNKMNPNYNPNNPNYHPNVAVNPNIGYVQQTTLVQNQPVVGANTPGWYNPYGRQVPVIKYDPNCKKCNGTGTSFSTFSKTKLPCTRCYAKNGYCKKCYGTGMRFRKNQACNCPNGKRVNSRNRNSSTSSSSDKQHRNQGFYQQQGNIVQPNQQLHHR